MLCSSALLLMPVMPPCLPIKFLSSPCFYSISQIIITNNSKSKKKRGRERAMELELGLKITHTRDDLTSMADLRITKDPSGPLFVSRETDTKFILIGHLKGFRKENIDIDINKEGNKISISGKKPVQEMVLKGWIMQKKEVEIRAFKKTFRIPDMVILDKIKAKFNEEISTLTIVMPKLLKGFTGVEIQEVKDEEVDRGRRPGTTQTVTDNVPENQSKKMEEEQDKVFEKGSDSESLKEETTEQRNADRVVEQTIDQGQSEATKAVSEEFPKRDDSREALKEKPEEPKKETELIQKVDGGESLALQSENVRESLQKGSKEPEVKRTKENDQIVEKSQGKSEIKQVTTEKVKPPKRVTFQSAASIEPEKEAKREIDRLEVKETLPTEENQNIKLPEERAPQEGLEEHVCSPANIESTKPGDDQHQVTQQSEHQSSPSTQVEEKHDTSENHQVNEKPEELQKQGPHAEIQEMAKPEPCQESNQEEISQPNHQADQPDKDEIQEKEDTQGNKIKEEDTTQERLSEGEVDGNEFQEGEKQKGNDEDAAKVKKSKRSKVCGPLVVAGSAFLVSFIVLVVHMIRSKKKQTTST